MLFNVSQLLREPVGAGRSATIDAVVQSPLEAGGDAHVAGPVELTRTPAGVLVRAALTGAVPATCDRCLGDAAIPLHLVIEEEYLPLVDPVTGGRLPEPEEPTDFRIDEQHHLDLTEAVRQALVMAEPMQVLCRPDCAGLCPECGQDRTRTPCRCAVQPVDDRWSALRRLQA